MNDRRVPRRLQEELLGSVTALVESIECVPPAVEDDGQVTDEDDDEADEDGKGKGNGKGKKKGKGKD